MRTLAILAVCVAAAWFVAHVFQPAEESAPDVGPREQTPREPVEPREVGALEGRPAPTADPTDVEVLGGVVDADGAPAAYVTVVLSVNEAQVAEVRTRADGAFRFLVRRSGAPGKRAGRVDVERGSAAATRAFEWTEPDPAYEEDAATPLRVDVGDLRLEEVAPTTVLVTAGEGGAVSATVQASRVGADGLGATWSAETGARGLATLPRLPAGTYRFVAAAPGYGRATAVLRLPRVDKGSILLRLDEERVVTVRVRDDAIAPLAGVSLHVHETPAGDARWPVPESLYAARTDADGVSVIRGLTAETPIVVTFAAAGYGASPSEAVVPPGATEVEFTMFRARAVWWPMKDGPPERSAVTVVPMGREVPDLPSWVTVTGGVLRAPAWPFGAPQAGAIAQDGSMAVLEVQWPNEKNALAIFTPPRRLRVRLRSEIGAPVVGWTVRAIPMFGTPVPTTGSTDTRGEVVFGGLYGGLHANVRAKAYARLPEGGTKEISLGGASLEKGDGLIEATIPERRTVRVEVRTDADELPKDLRLFVDGLPVRSPRRDGARTLVVAWQPSAGQSRLQAHVEAAGFVRAADAITFPPNRAPDPASLHVELQRPASIEVMLTLPPDGVHGIVLERGLTLAGQWRLATSYDLCGESSAPRQADAGRISFPTVEPGFYRARDVFSETISEPVSIGAGGTPLLLDLSRTGWVRGRVVPPEGARLADARVTVRLVPKEGPAVDLAKLPVAADGRFRLRVGGDRRLQLLPWDRSLLPDRAAVATFVTEPRDDVVLRLVSPR